MAGASGIVRASSGKTLVNEMSAAEMSVNSSAALYRRHRNNRKTVTYDKTACWRRLWFLIDNTASEYQWRNRAWVSAGSKKYRHEIASNEK